MSRVPGCPLSQLRAGSLVRSEVVYETCLQILVRLAEHGLVHCDLNEFVLMLDPAAAATASAEQLDQVAVSRTAPGPGPEHGYGARGAR